MKCSEYAPWYLKTCLPVAVPFLLQRGPSLQATAWSNLSNEIKTWGPIRGANVIAIYGRNHRQIMKSSTDLVSSLTCWIFWVWHGGEGSTSKLPTLLVTLAGWKWVLCLEACFSSTSMDSFDWWKDRSTSVVHLSLMSDHYLCPQDDRLL